MAELHKHDDREDWIRWAIEFVRRGLWPDEYITVHGPHDYPADHHWGIADCTFDSDPNSAAEIYFQSRRPCRKYVVRNVVMEADAPWGRQVFPVLKQSELSKRAQRWLRIAKRMLDNYEEERKQTRKKYQDLISEIKRGSNG